MTFSILLEPGLGEDRLIEGGKEGKREKLRKKGGKREKGEGKKGKEGKKREGP